MARARSRALRVYLNGRRVGLLTKESSGSIAFRYDGAWLAWEHALPVSLSLPLREDRYVGEPVAAVLDNLLPDNEMLRRRLAERSGAAGRDAHSILAAIGRDCVGALQFMPEGERIDTRGRITADPMTPKAVARLLSELGTAPLGITDGEFRISIAGAQEKTALLHWKRRWHRPRGTTPTTHILKPPIGRLGDGTDLSRSVENEYLCLKLCAALGLATATAEIEEFDGKVALSVRRFDRLWTRDRRLLRLPQEDCCQALSVPPTRKYESEGGPGIGRLLELLRGSDRPEDDRRAFLKAQVVFWLLAATDGHAKNFSLQLAPGGRFRLAPLYDVMSAQPMFDSGQLSRNKMKLAVAVGDRRHYVIESILPRHFAQTARRCGVPAESVAGIFKELLDQAPGAVAKVSRALPPRFPRALVDSIVGGFNRRIRLLSGS